MLLIYFYFECHFPLNRLITYSRLDLINFITVSSEDLYTLLKINAIFIIKTGK